MALVSKLGCAIAGSGDIVRRKDNERRSVRGPLVRGSDGLERVEKHVRRIVLQLIAESIHLVSFKSLFRRQFIFVHRLTHAVPMLNR